MFRVKLLTSSFRCTRKLSTSTSHGLQPVDRINGHFHELDVKTFRERAFVPGLPLHLALGSSPWTDTSSSSPVPAVLKWFKVAVEGKEENRPTKRRCILDQEYLGQFRDVTLPYELLIPRAGPGTGKNVVGDFREQVLEEIDSVTAALLDHFSNENSPDFQSFQPFNAPLSLFLAVSRLIEPTFQDSSSRPETPHCRPNLYIAQAQISDLPPQLKADLPTPNLVLEAGKGDVYDANIWLGCPPTYTPLHKDPNPNFFVQLASEKVVRLFKPNVGLQIFHRVQQEIGANSSASFRGAEMMHGREREALERAVWFAPHVEGFEVTVKQGDALFIPKGWWHSIRSVSLDVNASVNWWFR